MCNCNGELNKIDLSKMDSVIEKYLNVAGNLIPILQATQNIYGYLPMEALEYISENTKNKNKLFM